MLEVLEVADSFQTKLETLLVHPYLHPSNFWWWPCHWKKYFMRMHPLVVCWVALSSELHCVALCCVCQIWKIQQDLWHWPEHSAHVIANYSCRIQYKPQSIGEFNIWIMWVLMLMPNSKTNVRVWLEIHPMLTCSNSQRN